MFIADAHSNNAYPSYRYIKTNVLKLTITKGVRMNSSIYNDEELHKKIDAFIQRKADEYPELDLLNQKEDTQPMIKKTIFDALDSLIKLITGSPASTRRAHS